MSLNKLKQLVKRNLYLSITLEILAISLVFAGVILAIFSEDNDVDQTSIGFIYLGNSSETQYQSIIEREISDWHESAEFTVQFQGYSMELDLNWFTLDIDQTIAELTVNEDNNAYFDLSSENQILLLDALQSTFTADIMDSFNSELFIEALHSDLHQLYSRKTYELSDFLDADLFENVIDTTTLTNINSADVDAIISKVTTIEIEEQARFSLLDQIGGLGLTNEQMSIIASGLQGVVMNTNFNGFIFVQNTTTPTWAMPGHDVRILLVNQFDFTFFNSLDYGFTLTIEEVDASTLLFTLLGIPYITEYTSESLVQISIPYQTLYISDETIDETTPGVIITETDDEFIYRILIQSGVNGEVIFYNRTTTETGKDPVTIKLFDEQYLPVDEIYHEHIVEKVGG